MARFAEVTCLSHTALPSRWLSISIVIPSRWPCANPVSSGPLASTQDGHARNHLLSDY